MAFLRFLERHRVIVEYTAYALIVLLGIIDYFSGPDIAFSIFYLFPVFLVAWTRGLLRALPVTILSAAAWLIADVTSRIYYLHPAIYSWNALVRLVFFVTVAYFVSAQKNSLKREALLARVDYLTGLGNMKAFVDAAQREISRAKRYGHSCAVAYIDIDNFKIVNDTTGHIAGDALLRKIGIAIKENIRQTDFAARLGGDEFTILFPEIEPLQALAVANKLQSELMRLVAADAAPISFSIGLVSFVDPPRSVDEMLEAADKAMYIVKQNGKNAIHHETIS